MTHAIRAGTILLEDQIRAELATATLAQLDHQAARLWKEHAAGTLDETAVDRLSQEIHALKAARRSWRTPVTAPPGQAVEANRGDQPAPGAAAKPPRTWSLFPAKRPAQRSPDHAKSRERARTLAAASGLPPALAWQFTPGEQAALFVIAAECYARGLCDRCHDEIAARAGVSTSTVKRALRLAKRLGLVRIEERPQERAKHLPNIVRIISKEWAAWIAKRKPIGGQARTATGREDSQKRILGQRVVRGAASSRSTYHQNPTVGTASIPGWRKHR
ncbi:hypothetical protein [Methylobacterium sp. SyP6R]|uniref:hypothetical protein n=1 Tax=Methylobacterium sp. SyP6R TaxID=2718876 RepID=UPI001F2C8BF0|nr:hypothetical protein [Methylobacterium sp. SyP6R]MCF4130269.1 hypothetical protein [Methylobacterium sp. SyP6R]